MTMMTGSGPARGFGRRAARAGVATFAGTCLLLAPSVALGAPLTQPTLRVLSVLPANGTDLVGGRTTISVRFSAKLSASSVLPSLSPAVAGTWTPEGRTLSFVPSGAYPPDGTVTVTLPGGADGLVASDGATLRSTRSFAFTVADGSLLRAEQLLGELNYLPYTWRPLRRTPESHAQYEKAAFDPPAGRFVPIGQVPHQLEAIWKPGGPSLVWSSALGIFEQREGLPASGGLNAAIWSGLLRAARQPGVNANKAGFTYAVANKRLPETLTIWQDGRVVFNQLANTGIAESPTADGTYPVYLRLATQIMNGVAPWGTPYSDPVAWIAYFNGSDAVHYISRSSYGFPQSFGCVELPYTAAETAWHYLQLGTLVSVVG